MDAALFAIWYVLVPGLAAFAVGHAGRTWSSRLGWAARGVDWAGLSVVGAAFAAYVVTLHRAEDGLAAVLAPLGVVCLFQACGSLLRRSEWLIWIPGVALGAWLATQNGVVIDSVKPPFTEQFVRTGPWAALVTIGWALLVVTAFGSASHVRGAPLAIGAVVAAGMLVVCLLQPQVTGRAAQQVAAVLAAGCLGALLATRRAPEAAGSSGFLAVGFSVALLSVMGALKNTAFLIVVLPLMLIGVPLLDATYAVLYRRRRGETALAIESEPQRLHDILASARFSDTQILWLYVLGSVYLTLLAVFLVALIRVHFSVKLLILAVALPAGAALLWIIGKSTRRVSGAPTDGREMVAAWNVRLTGVTMEGAIATIDEFIRSKRPHHVVTSDVSAIVRAQEDEEFREIINRADMVTPDGAGVVWMGRLLDLPIYERVSGCDMAERIAELAASKGYSIYLLGARPGVAATAAQRLQARWPALRVAGTHHGYFSDEEETAVLQEIRDAAPDVLFVALGIPRQEKWIRAHLEDLAVPVAIGVGGSLDVIAGQVRRAPVWMRRMGLEWLYRTIREPRRLPRLWTLPKLLWMTLKAAWAARGSGANAALRRQR